MRRRFSDESGAVLVLVVVALPVLILMTSFGIDLGNWWAHKKHVQNSADAAALAAAGVFKFPCNDGQITNAALQYGGATETGYNDELHGKQLLLDVAVNEGGSPCGEMAVDVVSTEVGASGLFRGWLLADIKARARVEIQGLVGSSGMLPVGVEDPRPVRAAVYFIDEDRTDDPATAADERQVGGPVEIEGGEESGNWFGLAQVPRAHRRLGMRVALSGSEDHIGCTEPLVVCYELTGGQAPVALRGFDAAADAGAVGAPRLQDARLLPFGGTFGCGSQADPYFNEGDCTVGVQATVDFPTAAVLKDREVTLVSQGNDPRLTETAEGSGVFQLASGVEVPAAGGADVVLNWSMKLPIGSICPDQPPDTTPSTKPLTCTGTFGAVHRVFGRDRAFSGPITVAGIAGDTPDAHSYSLSATETMTLAIGVTVTGQMKVGDPYELAVLGSGSNNQHVQCELGAQLREMLAGGCRQGYRRNTGSTGDECPPSKTDLEAQFGTGTFWPCVATATGGAVGQVIQGLNDRVLNIPGDPECLTNFNHYGDWPDVPPGDPRIVKVFLVPFGAFDDQGTDVVPVSDLAFFYITGWAGKGQNNPCSSHPLEERVDDGHIRGHFIKYAQDNSDGSSGSGSACVVDDIGGCVAVMTR